MGRARMQQAMWATEKAHAYVISMRSCGGVVGTVMMIVWATVLVLLSLIGIGYPFLPDALLNYGWCYHILNVGMSALCLVIVGTRSKELITIIALTTSLIILPLNAWSMLANFVPWIVGCINSHPVTFFADCATDAVYTILMTAISIGLFLVSLTVAIQSFSLLSYINGAQRDFAAEERAEKDE